MQSFPINFLALLVAAIVKSVIGMIWYAPPVFGARWFKYVQCSEDEVKRGMPKALLVDLIGNFVMAFVLVHATHYAGAQGPVQGAAVGFFNWLGFVFAVMVAGANPEKRPYKLVFLNSGYQLVGMMAMGAIVATWT